VSVTQWPRSISRRLYLIRLLTEGVGASSGVELCNTLLVDPGVSFCYDDPTKERGRRPSVAINVYKLPIVAYNGPKMTTTIPLEKETRERLRSLGRKGETYDQVVNRLISLAEYEEFMTRQYERLKDKNAFISLDEI
jgi:hypothetical protein